MLRELVISALAVAKSNYSYKDKFKAFRILFSIHFKDVFPTNKEVVTQRIFGFKVTAYSYNALIYLFREIFLSNEYYFETVKSSPKIIDCGANIGMSILFFKNQYPDCSIMAFEPNPYAFELLEKNVKQNNLSNVQLFNIGLSNIDGKIDFFTNDNKGSMKGSFISERGGDNKISVAIKKLSSFIDTNTFDMIKIDVEGAEIQLLDDLITEDKIEQSDRYIIEYHHRIDEAKSEFSTFIKPFEDKNFEYNIKASFKPAESFQDILINLNKNTPNPAI